MNYNNANFPRSAYAGDCTKALLTKQGKSIGQLAIYLHMKVPTLSQHLSGRREMPLDEMLRIADYLHCSVDHLLGRTKAPDPWKATAVDELGLSENAVEVLMGRSPQTHRQIDQYIESGELSPPKAGLSSLESREGNIHRVVSALLNTLYFEDLLLAIENGLANKTGELRARALQKTVNAVLDDTPYIDADSKTYRVGGEQYAEYLKLTVLSQMQRVYEALLENADKILPAMAEVKETTKEVDHNGE